MMLTYANIGIAKSAGPLRRKVATNARMKIEQQRLFECAIGEELFLDVLLDFQNALGQQRRKFGIGLDAARSFYEASGARRLCRVFSHSRSTGSPSNAVLEAT